MADETSKSDVILSSGQATFLYWVTGLIVILKALTPLATYWGDLRKYNHLLPAQKAWKLYESVKSDVGRQTTTCTFQLVSYFVGGDIIKTLFRKLSPTKEDDPVGVAQQQVVTQVASLAIQVVATILSRPFGAAQLIRLLDQKEMPSTDGVQTPLQGRVNNWINQHLRDPKTKILQPGKAAAWATGGMIAYLSCLVGVLYGLSKLLENVLKPAKKHKPSPSVAPATLPLPAPPMQQLPAVFSMSPPPSPWTPMTPSFPASNPWRYPQRI